MRANTYISSIMLLLICIYSRCAVSEQDIPPLSTRPQSTLQEPTRLENHLPALVAPYFETALHVDYDTILFQYHLPAENYPTQPIMDYSIPLFGSHSRTCKHVFQRIAWNYAREFFERAKSAQEIQLGADSPENNSTQTLREFMLELRGRGPLKQSPRQIVHATVRFRKRRPSADAEYPRNEICVHVNAVENHYLRVFSRHDLVAGDLAGKLKALRSSKAHNSHRSMLVYGRADLPELVATLRTEEPYRACAPFRRYPPPVSWQLDEVDPMEFMHLYTKVREYVREVGRASSPAAALHIHTLMSVGRILWPESGRISAREAFCVTILRVESLDEESQPHKKFIEYTEPASPDQLFSAHRHAHPLIRQRRRSSGAARLTSSAQHFRQKAPKT